MTDVTVPSSDVVPITVGVIAVVVSLATARVDDAAKEVIAALGSEEAIFGKNTLCVVAASSG